MFRISIMIYNLPYIVNTDSTSAFRTSFDAVKNVYFLPHSYKFCKRSLYKCWASAIQNGNSGIGFGCLAHILNGVSLKEQFFFLNCLAICPLSAKFRQDFGKRHNFFFFFNSFWCKNRSHITIYTRMFVEQQQPEWARPKSSPHEYIYFNSLKLEMFGFFVL